MEASGAAKGELCALCRNPMNDGATVCGWCGAIRDVRRVYSNLRLLLGLFMLTASLFPACIVMIAGDGANRLASVMFGLAGVAGLAFGVWLLVGAKSRELVVYVKG